MFVLQVSNVLRASILTIFVVIVVVALSLFAKGPPGTDSLSIETNPRIASSGVGERRDLGGVEGSISLNVDPVVVNKAETEIHAFLNAQTTEWTAVFFPFWGIRGLLVNSTHVCTTSLASPNVAFE